MTIKIKEHHVILPQDIKVPTAVTFIMIPNSEVGVVASSIEPEVIIEHREKLERLIGKLVITGLETLQNQPIKQGPTVSLSRYARVYRIRDPNAEIMWEEEKKGKVENFVQWETKEVEY